ncbi:MAG: ABC transporter ATP-binding protein/permease [Methylomonas sp.]|nr:ABC transporter ATP-binding protein/permease [Methylomonas sp.]PPD21555.1 MAG: ABC transporter [Methylomonas sp.]PPD24937.1 MAG: ABC transporter [Methylomonas sp.]PPD34102.1 MAG: ABC transporter [Methylomonas sp.]PPD40488.1 MAG: ABC transporter [Methylomonas sp.]
MRTSSRFIIQFIKLAGPFWQSENKVRIRTFSAVLLVLTVLQIAISVVITVWSADLFDALDQRSMSRLLTQVGFIVLIFIANIAVTASHLVIKRRIQMDWRAWLTDRLISRWMNSGRHYLVTHIGGEHDNPDGRIAEDARIATEFAIDLIHSLTFSLLLLISFTEILWGLSGVITLDLGITDFQIRGHLVWLALLYAASAAILGWWIGRPLTKATDNRQTVEANFRFSLVKARENSMAIAMIQGERHETPHFKQLFSNIVTVWDEQTDAWKRIMMFTSGYSVLSMAFPILVSAPRYVLGVISLGALMQSALAFQHMVAALSWPVDNMGKIAEWRASVERILGLTSALDKLEREISKTDPKRIHRVKKDASVLRFSSLCLSRLDGIVCLASLDEEIKAGERVLITGNPYTGNKLFKAIAGLWPWGEGSIELPDDEPIFYMPPRPYLPTGTLRQAICYPASCDSYQQNQLETALHQVGLAELIAHLDESGDWEKNLEREQQQRLGMVRLLIHRPKWILLQEAFDSLDPHGEMAMIKLIDSNLPDVTLLTISKQPSIQAMHQRQITLC